jgi:hypothetical protein
MGVWKEGILIAKFAEMTYAREKLNFLLVQTRLKCLGIIRAKNTARGSHA